MSGSNGKAETPLLSLVTGTRNRELEFRQLLTSIERYTDVPWELIVADASDYAIQTHDLPSNVKVLPERPRLGHSKGYNRAFREARGEYVLWLNDDCEVMPGYATAAVEFMKRRPEIGMGAIPYSNLGGPFMVNSYMGMIYANFGILPRDFGNDIGWFDEDLRMYGCDNSIAFRVLLAGRGIARVPNAHIAHHESSDHERELNQFDRHEEADKLNRKYESRLGQMLQVYHRYL